MTKLGFYDWLVEHASPKAGKIACFPRAGDYSNIIRLDQALRLLARLDPLYNHSPELRSYAASKPWKSSLAD